MNPIYFQLLLELIRAMELLTQGNTEEAARITADVRARTDALMAEAEAHGM